MGTWTDDEGPMLNPGWGRIDESRDGGIAGIAKTDTIGGEGGIASDEETINSRKLAVKAYAIMQVRALVGGARIVWMGYLFPNRYGGYERILECFHIH